MTDLTRCDHCGIETPRDERRGWLTIRFFRPDIWDNPDIDEAGLDLDGCGVPCALKLLELASIGTGASDAS
jgi:hypothetical protein